MKSLFKKVVAESFSSSRAAEFLFLIPFYLLNLGISGCSDPGFVTTSVEGRQNIIDQVEIFLTDSRCTEAIKLIEPLYESSSSNNEIRLLRASAHGCNIGLNYFSFLQDLMETEIPNGKLWEMLTREFPSDTEDGKSESGWFATDALMATLNTGTVLDSSYAINFGETNEGSLRAIDRTLDANSYLSFISMALIGTGNNRYGDPDDNHQKQNDLPWTTRDDVDTEGCGYAGAMVNMVDSLTEAGDQLEGNIGDTLKEIGDTYSVAIDAACVLGCQGMGPDLTAGVDTDCTYTTDDCSECPTSLRNRETCLEDDMARCAAAGLVRFMNDDPAGQGWHDAE